MYVGSLLRLIGAAFALNSAFLFYRKNHQYLGKLRFALVFESLYFLLLLPTAINHLVGSLISTSAFLNVYTGLSALLQVLLIFPVLFILSTKLKNPNNTVSIIKWASLAVVLYVLGFWVKGGLMWVYAIYPVETPWSSLIGRVGFANSLFTLLVAAVVCAFVGLAFRRKNQLNLKLAGVVGVLVGGYFLVNDIVSIWDPVFRAFLLLTDFWMVSLLVLGVALLLDFIKPLGFS
jgi:hypothetical protein